MSLPRAALVAARALPAEPAVAVVRLLVLTYLLLRPDYRAEIRANFRLVCGRDDPWFWVRNGWRVGRNLAIMARIGTGQTDAIVDRAMIYMDNFSRRILEQNLHTAMVSFHFGLWELLPKVFARRGVDVAVASGRQRDRGLALELGRLRRLDSVVEADSPGSLVRRMRSRGLTGFMLDNTSQGRQEWFEAGGVRLRLPVAAFRLASRVGVRFAAISGFFEGGRLRVEVGCAEDESEAAAMLLRTVRRRPEEWVFWGKAGAVLPGGSAVMRARDENGRPEQS